MTDPDTIKRAKRTIELMNARLKALTDAERDRLIQQFMAEAMTTEERAKATMRLMNMSLTMQRRKLQREGKSIDTSQCNEFRPDECSAKRD